MTGGLVVTGKTVNTGFDQDQTVLGVLVLAVTFHVLTDGNGLLDKMVQIFRDFRSKTVGLQDTDDLVTSDRLDLGNAMGVTEDKTNLSRGKTLLGVLADEINNFFSVGLIIIINNSF